MWQSTNGEKAYYNDEQLEMEILSSWRRIFFIDGPSRCGKTHFLKHLNSGGVVISPFCVVLKELVEHLKQKGSLQQYSNAMEQRADCKLLGLEDIDIDLAGRPSTQEEIARLLDRLSQNRRIILTGIQIDKRCPYLLAALGENAYEYIRFVDTDES